MRFEITGTATDIWPVDVVQAALTAAKATAVSKRRAFGWSNQPYVATFAALDQEEADAIAARARAAIPGIESFGSLPGLYPRPYS